MQEISDWLGNSGVKYVVDKDRIELAGRGRERRFAGDESLDRGRYFALEDPELIRPETNTLMAELFAYASTEPGAIPRCLDSRYDHEALKHMNLPHNKDGNDYLLLTVPRAALVALGQDVPPPLSQITVPFVIYRDFYTIENVIDLRKHETAAWFAETFIGMEMEFQSKPRASQVVLVQPKLDRPRNFHELLPTLLEPAIGGNSFFIQSIGVWLRAHGASGLIFPSARTDSGVNQQNHWGFNFVSYEASVVPRQEVNFGRLPSWNSESSLGINIRASQADNSWYTDGVRAAQIARFRRNLSRDARLRKLHMEDLLERSYVVHKRNSGGYWDDEIFLKASSGTIVGLEEQYGPYGFSSPGQVDDLSCGYFEGVVSEGRWVRLPSKSMDKTFTFSYMVGGFDIDADQNAAGGVVSIQVLIWHSLLASRNRGGKKNFALLVISSTLSRALVLLDDEESAEMLAFELNRIASHLN